VTLVLYNALQYYIVTVILDYYKKNMKDKYFIELYIFFIFFFSEILGGLAPPLAAYADINADYFKLIYRPVYAPWPGRYCWTLGCITCGLRLLKASGKIHNWREN
jgi:hypothetical protein